MPMDSDGNRADIVMDPYATVNRMNPGRSYELYINAASRDLVKNIRLDMGIKENTHHTQQLVEEIFNSNHIKFDQNYRLLLGYYKILSPTMFKWYSEDVDNEEKINHLASIIKDGIYLYLPPDNPVDYPDVIEELEKSYIQIKKTRLQL